MTPGGFAYYRQMSNAALVVDRNGMVVIDVASEDSHAKSNLFSVRCVQD